MRRSLLVAAALAVLLSRAGVARGDGPSLRGGRAEVELPSGFSHVEVDAPEGALCTVIVLGPREALAHFRVHGAVAHDAIDEDGMLPMAASFFAGDEPVWVGVEVHEPVRARRVCTERTTTLPTEDDRVLLIGMPTPARRDDGYVLERPNRYQFARPDVVFLLRDAFKATRTRFRRDPIGIADITQWDGRKPALDVDKPRHISHDGGRDVDIALPALDEPSRMGDHCEKDYNDDRSSASCKPGTGKGVDTMRLAFLVATLHKLGVLDKVFVDREFIEATARSAEKLAKWGWIAKKSAAALAPDGGVIVHVPWHTDHAHLRFLGARALAPFPS